LDNARIHHGEEIIELVERFGMSYSFIVFDLNLNLLLSGVRLKYLPPYSPDLNPIEEAFSKIKHYIRRHNDIFLSITDDHGLLYDMMQVFDIITPSDAQGYFQHAGYG
jgi:transposase